MQSVQNGFSLFFFTFLFPFFTFHSKITNFAPANIIIRYMNKRKSISHLISTATLAVVVGILSSCGGEKFHVEGNITDADEAVLYFENMSLSGPVVLDSLKLKADGHFHFAHQATDAPEFYRLRIGNQLINLSIDSTETVTIKAAAATMGSQYTVEGSDDCEKIKELTLLQMQLQKDLQTVARDPSLGISVVGDSLDKVMSAYKEKVKREYIYQAPMRPYAYFALFQTVTVGGGQGALIFNPRASEEDIRTYAAVATSWDTYYPHSERGQNLHNIAIEAMKDQRIIHNRQNSVLEIDMSKVDVTNSVDIELPDSKGQIRRLSDLKGKVVILDFCLYSVDGATERIMALREVYNKYHAQGLEIYQIGYDGNEHFWKTQTAALPWTCVYDGDLNSLNLMRYNVMTLPTFFLVQRDNTIHKRDAQIVDLDKEIRSLL